MNEQNISHRRVRTQPLATVLIRARTADLITDIERLAEVAGVDTAAVAPGEDAPPAVLTLLEDQAGAVRASFNELFQPEFAGKCVLVSPRTQPADLLELFVAAGASQRGQIIGVLGAHGGAGASVCAAMVARQLAGDRAATTLVDMDPYSGGLGEMLSLEERGKRWPDITQESGTLLPGRLAASLPRWHGVQVLSGDRRGGVPTTGRSGILAVGSLAQVSAVTVLDLPRLVLHKQGAAHEWLSWLDHLLLITRPHLLSLAAARRVLGLLPDVDTTLIVGGVRSIGQAEDAAHQLGVTDACPLRFERTFDGDIEHGMSPGDRLRSGSARDIRRIATRVLQ
ncbi:MAG: hypothetical protein Q4P33_08505 [Flaviflexus sp.]|nr:hypothetical protein [Flaviflexus sp.]